MYIASGLAETERQMVKRNKLEIWVNFEVAAPRPWGENQKSNPPKWYTLRYTLVYTTRDHYGITYSLLLSLSHSALSLH